MKLTFLSATFFTIVLASAHAAIFTVSTTNNAGAGSLRQAILDANGTGGDNTIAFTTNGTITLASPLPTVTDNLTIAGPGTNLLTITGNNAVQVFTLSAGTTNTISGLTIANGLATGYANGAAIYNAGELTILDCSLVDNTNHGGWGGAIFNSGNVSITNSVFSENQVTAEDGSGMNAQTWGHAGGGGGAAGEGGGFFNMSGTAIMAGCIFMGNSATGGNGGGLLCTNCTGRGGGINGGEAGGDGAPGNPGGYGGGGGGGGSAFISEPPNNIPGGNGGPGGFGGGGGGPGGGDFGGGSGGKGGFGGGSGSTPPGQGGAGGGGGAGLGGGIFVDSGTVTLVNCVFPGNQATGGLGGMFGTLTAGNGLGFVGGVFERNGTVILSNSPVNVITTNTPSETWTNGPLQYLAPVGTPQVFADGQFVLGNIVKRTSTQISLQTSFPVATVVYSLDGSDPRTNSTLYSGPFSVGYSTILRVVAYNSNFTASVEMDAVQITILPTLTATTPGGGTISITPTNGPYFANSLAQITAQPASGFTFLQWIGDASGTNPTTTVTMNRNRYVEAFFGTTVGNIVIGAGSMTVDPSLPLYPFGTVIKFTAQPQSGNYFAAWGSSASGTNNPLTFVVSNSGQSVAAVFSTLAGDENSLTVIESGYGHVTRSPYANFYPNAQQVSLTALPDAGQDFIAWSGSATGTENPLLVTISSNMVIHANFTERPTLRVGTPLEGLFENVFRLTILGEFGTNYSVLVSTNLLDWTAVGTVTNTYGTVQFTDPSATNSPQFYRAESH